MKAGKEKVKRPQRDFKVASVHLAELMPHFLSVKETILDQFLL